MGASVALGEVSLSVVAVCAERCWHVSKRMAQGGHLVWAGGPRPRPQKGFGVVAKVAVLAGLLCVPLQFLARGPSARQWGTHWPG